MRKATKIGVAGVGRIGAMHAANLATTPGVDQVVLYDPQPGRAETVASKIGASSVASIEELLSAVDGVVIATPTDTHPVMVRAALAAKTPVLCEKPLAADVSTAAELITDIDDSGVTVLVGFHRRFDPPTVELHRKLRSGEAGSVYLMRAVANDREPPPMEFIATSGGLFRDCLIHDLDAVPWLMNEPVTSVYASGSVLVDPAFAAADDVDNAVVLLRFASGANAVLSAARHDPLGYDCRIEVFASKDTLAVGVDEHTPLRSLQPGVSAPVAPWPGFIERYQDAYRNELASFLRVIDGDLENPSPARESLISLRLADACAESVRSGKPVPMGTSR